MENSKHRHLGLLIHDSYTDYTKEMISGIMEFCNQNDCSLLVFPVGELGISYSPFEYQHRAIAAFANSNNIDGLIIATSTQGNHVPHSELVDYVHTFSDIPKVSIGIEIDKVPSLIVDCEPGLRSVVEDLIKNHDRKKFGVIGVNGDSAEAIERTSVIKKILKENNIALSDDDIMLAGFTYETAYDAILKHVNNFGSFDYDAVLCLNDDMAFACIDYCKKIGKNIPEDISITGFDDIQRSAFVTPTLTSVNQQTAKQGYIAAETLYKLINKTDVPLIQNISTVAYFRQSCGCVDIKDFSTNYITQDKKSVDHKSSDNISSVVEWIAKKSQLLKMNFFHSSSQVQINLDEFRKSFQGNIQQFDINSAAICMFDPPIKKNIYYTSFELPNEAFLIASFDNRKNYFQDPEKEPVKFDPRDKLLPTDFMDSNKGKCFISTISNCENVYGYMIYEVGSFEELLYEMMVTITSQLLSTAYENAKKEETQRMLSEKNEMLSIMSTTDEITNLLNRRGFMNFGQQSIYMGLCQDKEGLVLFGDMDGLKQINDTYGHDAGDQAIKAEAKILRNTFRSTDIIGRIGGDEFCIVAVGLPERTFPRIKNTIDIACKIWNQESKAPYKLSISIGYAKYDKSNSNLAVILQKADEVLYQEKKRKKSIEP